MTTKQSSEEKIEDKIYSILFDHSRLSEGNIGVRVAFEDEWPLKELADLLTAQKKKMLQMCEEMKKPLLPDSEWDDTRGQKIVCNQTLDDLKRRVEGEI